MLEILGSIAVLVVTFYAIMYFTEKNNRKEEELRQKINFMNEHSITFSKYDIRPGAITLEKEQQILMAESNEIIQEEIKTSLKRKKETEIWLKNINIYQYQNIDEILKVFQEDELLSEYELKSRLSSIYSNQSIINEKIDEWITNYCIEKDNHANYKLRITSVKHPYKKQELNLPESINISEYKIPERRNQFRNH